jgi:hypothetical protein
MARHSYAASGRKSKTFSRADHQADPPRPASQPANKRPVMVQAMAMKAGAARFARDQWQCASYNMV